MVGPHAEQLLPVRLAAEVGGQLLELLLVVAEMEAQVLLQPQYVLDQAEALLFQFVLVQQPEQGDDGRQQQYDAQLGQGEKPAQAAGADGLRKRVHERMLERLPRWLQPVENHNADVHNGQGGRRR